MGRGGGLGRGCFESDGALDGDVLQLHLGGFELGGEGGFGEGEEFGVGFAAVYGDVDHVGNGLEPSLLLTTLFQNLFVCYSL